MSGGPSERRAVRAVAGLLLVVAGGCRISMRLPEPFLQLDTAGAELKATTPDDARVWVREFDDRDQGTLAFWAASMQNEFTAGRGYELVGAEEVRDGAGRVGRLLQLRAVVNGERWGYLVAVFVREGTWRNTIRVTEFVAREEVFAVHADAVRAALATLRP